MIIQNFAELATSREREVALRIISAGIERVLPARIITEAVSFEDGYLVIDGDRHALRKGRLLVVGGGKASGAMAETLERLLGPELITEGIVNCKSSGYHTRRVRIIPAGHPIPDEAGLAGVEKMLALKEKYRLSQKDMVLCLISGGGSALLTYPAETITFADKQLTTGLLLRSGAGIREVNAVRKHLSRVKGGRFARHYHPARVIALILSDVVGDHLDTIASGPTYYDPSTFGDAYNILERHSLLEQIPTPVKDYFLRGIRGEVEETPKELPGNTVNYLIGNNRIALEAMAAEARRLGYQPEILTAELTGEASREAGKIAQQILKTGLRQPKAVILGGESTVTVGRKTGQGGRNQEYVAASIRLLSGLKCPWALASVGSDGTDFLPAVAGGIIDHTSVYSANERKLPVEKFIANHDTYHLLILLNGLVSTGGNTGTNVCDLVVYVLNPGF